MDQRALLDLQRLTDRAVQRFASDPASAMGKLQANHLKAYISQIESALSALRAEGDTDELDVVYSQLSLLRSVYDCAIGGASGGAGGGADGGKKGAAGKTWAQVVFESDDSDGDDDDGKPLLAAAPAPAQSPSKESRFASSLRQRPAPKPTKQAPEPDNSTPHNTPPDKTIFRDEHDHLSAALLHHSAALKANSERMSALLKDDRQSVSEVERLMDNTEGSFGGHTKRLGEQVKAESWGILKTLMVLVVGFVLFLFMFIFIRLT